jgi:uncharacterized protein DUF6361
VRGGGVASFIAWIDHDETERERMKRILALFSERDTRDELGLGAIRDSISDHLFPGTSTIQTRLRYMLFVPWLYQRLEHAETSSERIVDKARQAELKLSEALLASGDEDGVFGRRARGSLRRLPSSVYWAGLGHWGIRRLPGSQDAYHHALNSIYKSRLTSRRQEDGGWEPEGAITWARTPPPPEGFPERASCRLTLQEADYLTERVIDTHPQSLLAYVMRERAYADAALVWQHPRYADFPDGCRPLLRQARLLSETMFGASILYNLLLSELTGSAERSERYRTALGDWAAEIDGRYVGRWDLEELWARAAHPAHQITWATRRFVARWVEFVAAGAAGLADSNPARKLVEERERTLKRVQSRLGNPAMRARWGGASGFTRLSFRWPNVRNFLRDLQDAV